MATTKLLTFGARSAPCTKRTPWFRRWLPSQQNQSTVWERICLDARRFSGARVDIRN